MLHPTDSPASLLSPPGSLSKLPRARKDSDRKPADLPSCVPACLVRGLQAAGVAHYCFPAQGRPSRLQVWWRQFNKDRALRTLLLICACIFSVSTCQNLMAPNLTAIAEAYNITNEVEKDAKMGGQLATAFFVFSMPLFLTVGFYTDRWDRRKLLIGVTVANAASTLLTALSSSYAQLFLLRVVSGGTVMSILPVAYSVLGDLFPPKTRGSMSTALIVAMGAGMIIGQLMSGLLGPTVGWRATFVIASVPGFGMSALAHRYAQMPKRGEMDLAEARRAAELGGAGDLEDPPRKSGGAYSDEANVGGGDSDARVPGHGFDDGGDGGSGASSTGGSASGHSAASSSSSSASAPAPGGCAQNSEVQAPPLTLPGSADGTAAGAAGTAGVLTSQVALLSTIFRTKTNVLLFAQCIPGSVPWGVLFVFMNDYLAQEKGLTVEQSTGRISLFGMGAAVGGVLGGVWGQRIYNKRSRNISLFMGCVQAFSVPLMWRIIDAEYTSANLSVNLFIIMCAGLIASMAGTNVRFLLTNVNSPSTRGFVMSIFDVFNNIGKGLGPLIVSWLVQYMGSRRVGYDIAMVAWWLDAFFMACTFFTVEEDERRAAGGGKGGRRRTGSDGHHTL